MPNHHLLSYSSAQVTNDRKVISDQERTSALYVVVVIAPLVITFNLTSVSEENTALEPQILPKWRHLRSPSALLIVRFYSIESLYTSHEKQLYSNCILHAHSWGTGVFWHSFIFHSVFGQLWQIIILRAEGKISNDKNKW